MRTDSRSFRLEAWTLALGGVAVVLTHAPLLGYRAYANVDEAYASALASRLIDGYKLYEGAISQRGPLMYYAFEAFAWLHGWDNILALRIWALLLAFAHVLLVLVTARKLVSREASAVAIALTCYALAFGFPVEDGVAVNGETLQLPAMMGGVLLQARAMAFATGSSERLTRLLGGGLLLGAALAIKQGAVIQLIPIALWSLSELRVHRRVRTTLFELVVAVGSSMIIPAIFALHSFLQGTLSALYYYTVIYNRSVHLRPAPSFPFAWINPLFHRLVFLTGFFVVCAVLVGAVVPYVVRRARAVVVERDAGASLRGFGPRHFLGLHFALAAVTASMMYRFFPHYYVQALPFLSLCVGIALERVMRSSTGRGGLIGFSVFSVFAAGVGCYFSERVDGRAAHDDTVDSMARIVAATTDPGDRVFVWGFAPWINGYARRKPASRFFFSTYVTGYVPWFPESVEVERARVVPGSREALLSDLEAEKPPVIVDAGAVMMLRPMRSYAEFSSYLHEHYCFDLRVGSMDLYRRRAEGATCAQPHFPRVAAPVDYQGHLIPALIPKQVDAATSKRLPEGNFFKPIYFLEGPVPIGVDAARTKRRDKDEADARKRGLCVPELGSPDCSE